MSEEEYASILDTAEDEPIIIIPEDDEERDYTQCTTRIEPGISEKTAEVKKRTAAGLIRDFWYYHKNAVIILVAFAVFIGMFIYSAVVKTTNDLTVAVFSENAFSDSDQMTVRMFLADYVPDFDGDDTGAVGGDFFVTADDDYTAAQIEADYKNRIRCIYFTTKESFEYITELYPDMFESYNGCDLWIPLSGTDLCRDLSAQDTDVSKLGISLVARQEGNTEYYERAVALLDALREKYPEIFEQV